MAYSDVAPAPCRASRGCGARDDQPFTTRPRPGATAYPGLVTRRDDEPVDPARAEADDLAWREIVDHYGEAPDVDGLVELTAPLEEPDSEKGDQPEQEPFRFELEDETFTPP